MVIGCEAEPPPAAKPNILWVVFDTARADHMSLYGYERETTPRLDAWAQGARVFDDARSVASYTLPSHASMFTGLLPSEHCTNNDHKRLDDRHTTLAELLRDAGYQTFLFSSNPHVSSGPRNFDQGFDQAEGPTDPRWEDAARKHLRKKFGLADDARGNANPWSLAASGPLAQLATREWLDTIDRGRPFFVFLNYMEAHAPYLPSLQARRRLMIPGQGERNRAALDWTTLWEYTFGLRELSSKQIQSQRNEYDATLLDLDDLFAELLQTLDDAGFLKNTVVVLTSDHGEHLGEKHMFDHQYSLYEPVLRVPLVIHDPRRFAPGRDPRPVMNLDIFATLLEIAGLEVPDGTRSVSLLRPASARLRIAEEPALTRVGIPRVRRRHPEWDPSGFTRRLRAATETPYKYIWASDGKHALYDLASDPLEQRNRLEEDPERAAQLDRALTEQAATFANCASEAEPVPVDSPKQRRLLEQLGYIEEGG